MANITLEIEKLLSGQLSESEEKHFRQFIVHNKDLYNELELIVYIIIFFKRLNSDELRYEEVLDASVSFGETKKEKDPILPFKHEDNEGYFEPKLCAAWESRPTPFESFLDAIKYKSLVFLNTKFSLLTKEDIEDVFQDASIILHEKIEKGEISMNSVNGSLYSYFLKICVNLAYNMSRKKKKKSSIEVDEIQISRKNPILYEKVQEQYALFQDADSNESDRKERLIAAILQSGSSTRCFELFQYYYGEEMSWDTVATLIGLSNAATAKTMASRCRKKIRESYNYYKDKIFID